VSDGCRATRVVSLGYARYLVDTTRNGEVARAWPWPGSRAGRDPHYPQIICTDVHPFTTYVSQAPKHVFWPSQVAPHEPSEDGPHSQ